MTECFCCGWWPARLIIWTGWIQIGICPRCRDCREIA